MTPLEGIKVLDLSRVLAGPWASQLLSDLGAGVIKVEHPVRGDDTRQWGPPDLLDENGTSTGEAAYYLCANRGKRSLALDIRTPQAQDIIRGLARDADIVIENFKLGGLKKYGLDAASLRALNPRLIYCSITGFGQTGPYASRPGYDFVIQGMSGLMSVTGTPEDEPTKVGIPLADLATGLYATIGILAALNRRHVTGEGEVIDMALLDVMIGLQANQNTSYLTTGTAPGRMGNAHPSIVPYQAFDTQDGALVLAAGNDGQYHAFCRVAGCDDLGSDPRFATNPERVRNRALLVPLLAEIFKTRTTTDWVTALINAGVPAGPVYTIAEAFQDPHVVARGLLEQVAHPLGGLAPTVRMPIRFQEADIKPPTAPPLLGQDSREVLRAHGLSDQSIDELIEAGIVNAYGEERV